MSSLQEAMGYSVRIFMPEGQPAGIRIVSKSHWTGQGIVFPRSLLPEIQNHITGFGGCVYVLWGVDEEREALLPDVYVGQTNDIYRRLQNHWTDEKKVFWAQTVVFTSTDQSLNLAHIQFIEAELFAIASKAKKCQLTNDNAPSKPTLSPADRADAESFLSDLLLCLPLCGAGFFSEPEKPTEVTTSLNLSEKQISATGYESAGGFVVLRDSQTVADENVAATLHQSSKKLRDELKAQNLLVPKEGLYSVASDYEFNSPSQAAGVLLGSSYNGLDVWKDAEGRTLNELRRQRANNSPVT